MYFVHRAYDPTRTCAAIATAVGPSGIAVVRISGVNALAITAKIFSGPVETYKGHTVHYGTIHTVDGKKIDDVLLLVMRAPRSFTGDDTVEIHCHGGSLIPKMVLQAALDAGASPAEAGEFSFKGFMNGKMDLLQAEAIQAKIAAKNELALSCAQEQMDGVLSKKVRQWQKELTDIGAIFEAWVDFPEEGLEFSSFEEVSERLEKIAAQMHSLMVTFDATTPIREGVAVSIVGSPNVGKSSLLNALLGQERAIVSPIAGTTRDIVEDQLRVNGLHLRLIDTAGIRETDELIEQEGIRRSKKAIDRADVVLLVLDITSPYVHEPFFETLPKDKTVVIWNKIDLASQECISAQPNLAFAHTVQVSAKNSFGLESLCAAIDAVVWKEGALRQEEGILTLLRHKEALEKAIAALARVLEGLKNEVSCEFIAFDMRLTLTELAHIIGNDVTDELITAVFSSFCIGK